MNGKGGYVPSGTYGSNTRINYCCRYRVIRISMFPDDFKYLTRMKALYMVFGKCKKKLTATTIRRLQLHVSLPKLFFLAHFRSDGSAYSYISLPTTDPFYLMRYTSSICQRVSGMSVTEEIIETDDEDSVNTNSVSGSHPKVTGSRNHRLYYCYYS